jgi:hypothetical protein
VFRVIAGKLLGFPVSHQGIEANLGKIKMIVAMQLPPISKMCRSSRDALLR